MATNNKKQCLQALSELEIMDYHMECGKNPMQVLKVIIDGMTFKTGQTYTVEQFITLFEENMPDSSVATSKYNDVNEDEEVKEMQAWVSREATYAKKCSYDYEHESLNGILTMTAEDYGFNYKTVMEFHDDWNSEDGWKARIYQDFLVEKGGVYTPMSALECTCKQWLSKHGLYEQYRFYIRDIIGNWARHKGE